MATTLNVPDILRDREFRKLSPEAQVHALRQADPEFGKLSLDAQLATLDDPDFQPEPLPLSSPVSAGAEAGRRGKRLRAASTKIDTPGPQLEKEALRKPAGPQLAVEPARVDQAPPRRTVRDVADEVELIERQGEGKTDAQKIALYGEHLGGSRKSFREVVADVNRFAQFSEFFEKQRQPLLASAQRRGGFALSDAEKIELRGTPLAVINPNLPGPRLRQPKQFEPTVDLTQATDLLASTKETDRRIAAVSGQPLPTPEEAATMTDAAAQLAVGSIRKLSQIATDLSRPDVMVPLIYTIALGPAAKAGSATAQTALRSISSYFAYEGAEGVSQALTGQSLGDIGRRAVEVISSDRSLADVVPLNPELKRAIDEKDYEAIGGIIAETGFSGLVAVGAGKHALRGTGARLRSAAADFKPGRRFGRAVEAPIAEVIPPKRGERGTGLGEAPEAINIRGEEVKPAGLPPDRRTAEDVLRDSAGKTGIDVDAELARIELLRRRAADKRPGDLEGLVEETLRPEAAQQPRTRRAARSAVEAVEGRTEDILTGKPEPKLPAGETKAAPGETAQPGSTRIEPSQPASGKPEKIPSSPVGKEEPLPRFTADTPAGAAKASPADAAVIGDKGVDKSTPLPEIPKAATERPKLAARREPSKPPAKGREVEVLVPDTERSYQARFAIREAADVYSSHDPLTFQPNPDYDYRNDRDYTEPATQDSVLADFNKFAPGFQLSDSPTAEHGPPLVDPSGNALGGNKRTLVLKRLIEQKPGTYAKYVEQLRKKAKSFGLDPKEIDRFERPMLVREVAPGADFDAQRAITDFNFKGSAPLTEHEQSFTDSTRISQDTLDFVTQKLEEAGESSTLARALEGDVGPEVVDRLIKDEVLQTGEKRRLLDERGHLSDQAKERISNVLLGRVFRDAEQIKRTRPAIRRNLERSLPHIIRIEKRPDWNVLPDVQRAVDVLEYAEATGLKNLEDLARQKKMAKAPPMDARSLVLARKLRQGPLKAASAFRQYANEARYSETGAPATFFDAPGPDEAFVAAFGALIEPREARIRPRLDRPEVLRSRSPQSIVRGNVSRPPVLYLNRPAAEFLRKAALIHLRENAAGGAIPIDAGNFALLDRGMQRVLRRAVEVAPSQLKNLVRLRENLLRLYDLSEQRGDPFASVIVLDDQLRAEKRIRPLLRHERFHVAQARQALTQIESDPAFEAYRSSPAVARAVERLVEDFGYDAALARAMEVPAWIASGEYGSIGLTRGEAVEALALYYEAAEKVRSAGARELLRFVIPTLAEEIGLAQRSIRERTRLRTQRQDAPDQRPALRGIPEGRSSGPRQGVRRTSSGTAAGRQQLRLFEGRRQRRIDDRQLTLFGEPPHAPETTAQPRPPAPRPRTTPAATSRAGDRPDLRDDVRGADGPRDRGGIGQGKKIVATGQARIGPADSSGLPEPARAQLTPFQLDGAAAAIRAMTGQVNERGYGIGDNGFLLADGTGVGKTPQGLTVAKVFAEQYGQAVLVVSKAEVFKFNSKGVPSGSYLEWAKRLRLFPVRYKGGPLSPGTIYLATYSDLHKVPEFETGFRLILDEAHALKNVESQRAKLGMSLIGRSAGTLYMTATPADKPEHIQYLDRAGILEGKLPSEKLRDLGMTLRTIRVGKGRTRQIWAVNPHIGAAEVDRRLGALFARMVENGRMLKREISLDGVNLAVEKIRLPAEAHAVIDKIELALPGDKGLQRAVKLMHQRRQQEPYKIQRAVELAKQELAEGRKVILFVSRVNESAVKRKVRNEEGDVIDEILIHESEGTAKLLREALAQQGIRSLVELHGGAELKAAEAMDRFQSGQADVMIATMESGGTGINLDDVTGDAPRSMVVITAPFSAVENVQAVGRVWRMSTQSLPRVFYLFGDTPVDTWNADIISGKMQTLGALVKGETTKLDLERIERRRLFEARRPKPAPLDPRQAGMFSGDEETARTQANAERAGEISGKRLTEQFQKGPLKSIDKGKESIEDAPLFGGPRQKSLLEARRPKPPDERQLGLFGGAPPEAAARPTVRLPKPSLQTSAKPPGQPNRPQREVVTVDAARLAYGSDLSGKESGDIDRAYSADKIAEGKPIRPPFPHDGQLWVTVAGSALGTDAFRLVPLSKFQGKPTTYRERTATMEAGEQARNDPMGFYHGMVVKHKGASWVLQGPEVRFTAATASKPAVPAKPAPVRLANPKAADTLTKAAATAREQAKAKRNSGIFGQNVTRRRASIGDSLIQDAERLETLAGRLEALAELQREGRVPEALANVTSKALVEDLSSKHATKVPSVHISHYDLDALLADTKGMQGHGEASRALAGVRHESALSEAQIGHIEKLRAIVKARGKRDPVGASSMYHYSLPKYRRFLKAGLDTDAKVQAAHDAVLDLGKKVENTQSPIQKAERELRLQKIEGFFPTPKKLADRMADLLEVQDTHTVLEPSAGKGDLVEAVQRVSRAKVSTAERYVPLRELLRLKGMDPIAEDAFEVEGEFDRIIMNPPFEKGADADQVRKAYDDNLKPGGRLVALMSSGPFFRSDRKAQAFREFVDDVGGEVQDVEPGAFQGVESFRQTGVNVKLLVLDKPAAKADAATKLQREITGSAPAPQAGQRSLFEARRPQEPDSPLFRDREAGAVDVDLLTLGLTKTLREDVVPTARDAAHALAQAADDIRRALMPTGRAPEGARTGEILRETLAVMARRYDRAEKAMAKAQRFFRDRPAADNYQFIRRVESGAPQASAELDAIAGVMRSILDGRRADVQALGKGKLQKFYQNYFPHIWKRRRGANNAEVFFGEWFGRRPFEGKKAFLKKRTHPTFEDGLNAGLEPVTDNPVELVLLKVKEMDRYIAAHEALREFRKAGVARFVPVDRHGPTAWRKIDDPIGTVYGDPAVNVSEFFDARVMNQLNAFAKSMGFQIITSQRLKGEAAGVAYRGTGVVKRRFATPWDVIAHEIGHQLDWKYGLQARLMKGPPPKGVKEAKADRTRRVAIQKQLRALADLRYEGAVPDPAYAQYVRRKGEKMAAVVQAYLYAPEKIRQVAPDVLAEFETLISENLTELGALRHIKPSLVLGSNASQFRIQGLLIKGHWWMPEAGATVFNNYLMPGLRHKSGLFRAALGVNNVLNQAQLGFSAFHLANTTYDSVASKFGLGFYQLAQGKPSGLVHMLEAPLGPVIHQYYGHKLRNEWFRPGRGGAELAAIAEAMTMAGGRVRMDVGFRTNFRDKFVQALRRGNVVGAALRAPFAAVETAAWPIMEFIVPRQKLGVFYELAQTEMRRLGPSAPRDEVRRALQRAWDVVDDRLGEVVYDNLFWNRYAKDLQMIAVRSVGWNWGTFRVLIGGAKDVALAPAKLVTHRFGGQLRQRTEENFTAQKHGLRPSDPVLSHRGAYMLGFIGVTAAAGAILMKLLTGEWPETIEDYFFPRTGELDENGRPRRIAQPTYLKDAVHYYHEPGRTLANKVSPIVDLATDMLSNKDFYGTEIRHPDDPLFDQFLDVMARTGEAFTPFGFREMQRADEQGRSTRAKVLPFFGMVPAPKIITSSPAEELALRYLRAKRPVGARTKLESERGRLRGRLRNALRHELQGTPNGLSAADVAREGAAAGLFTKRDLTSAIKEAPLPPLVSMFRRLELEEAIRVYEEADPDERRLLAESMWGKTEKVNGREKRTPGKVDLLLNKPPAEQERLAARIRALIPQKKAVGQ